MSNNQAELLGAILDEPDDDLPRLQYADWCEEHGEGERAEFIRVQIALAGLDAILCHQPGAKLGDWCNDTLCPKCGREDALRRRERELLANGGRVFGWLGNWTWRLSPGMPAIHHGRAGRCIVYYESPDEDPQWEAVFRRGFVHAITCSTADFLAHVEALFTAQPILEVTLAGMVPQYYVGIGEYGEPVCGWYHGVREPQDFFNVPDPVWHLLTQLPGCEVHGPWADFPTEEEAYAALSNSCVAYGRELVGLPVLPARARREVVYD